MLYCYLVALYVDDEGYKINPNDFESFESKSKIFFVKEKAEKYAEKMNKEANYQDFFSNCGYCVEKIAIDEDLHACITY